MNYSKIYQDFIVSRREREASIVGYLERHHIKPRSLGGDNSVSNMIRLTPEDHFFAHLLLAKIHGGVMWAPIAIMSGGNRINYKPTISRLLHGWAKRRIAHSKKGAGSYQFDSTVYHFVNTKGRVWSGLQSAAHVELGISKSLVNMLIKGRVSVAKGWSVSGRERKTLIGSRHHMYKHEKLLFLHVDGRSFTGTQFEFSEFANLHRPAVCKLVLGESKVWNGWYIEGTVLPTTGRGAKWAKMSLK